MGETFAMKVLGRAAGRKVSEGETVTVEPDFVLTHDNTSAIAGEFERTVPDGVVRFPERLVVVLDHVVPAATSEQAASHALTREFVRKQGIDRFYDAGSGVCHQVLPEKGLAAPGSIIVGADSHTRTYGAFNCFATGIDSTEAAGIWISGRTCFRVPETISLNLAGVLGHGVSAKDLVLTIIGDIGAEGAKCMSVEFHGPALGNLRINDRMTIANMGMEMGAKLAVFPADSYTEAFLGPRGVDTSGAVWSDHDAEYAEERSYDLEEVVPVVASPHSVDNVVPVRDLPETRIDQVFLGTCTNGRLEDLEAAADILRNHQVAPGVRLLVGPASREVLWRSMEQGVLQVLVAAGAVVLPAGCGPCLGAHQGALAPGERCLSTANGNSRGRMGEMEAEIYLGSPETAAASAITGRITDPREVIE